MSDYTECESRDLCDEVQTELAVRENLLREIVAASRKSLVCDYDGQTDEFDVLIERAAALVGEPAAASASMNEQDILNNKPFSDTTPEPTLEDRANDLVNAMMHQLRTHGELTYVIDSFSDQKKSLIHNQLLSIAIIALKNEPLIETPHTNEVTPPKSSGEPLEPALEGEVFQMQPGGLLLSQQVKE